jgi:arabinose-5-phosphate isomerase
MDVLSSARQTIQSQARSLLGLLPLLDAAFERAVDIIYKCSGRVVVSGIGKSAIIAQKIVATFNSTGTPAVYLHAADAIHGDVGTVQPGDVVLIISRSGNTPEIKALVPLVKSFGNTVIGVTGKVQSFLAGQADAVLNVTVQEEACPHNLAPTNSTTAQLVMGDALAICIMQLRNFSSQDFARFHPGGTLGRQLYLQVKDLITHNEVPQVLPAANLQQVIMEMTRKRLGATAVVAEDGAVYGIITDGDLRRMLERDSDLRTILAKDICTPNPKTIAPDALAVHALGMLRQHDISQLLVVHNGHYTGMMHFHDLLREGLV